MAIASTWTDPSPAAPTSVALSAGWLVSVDENRSRQVDDDTIVLHREDRANDGVTVQATDPSKTAVSEMLGFSSGALQMGTLVIA